MILTKTELGYQAMSKKHLHHHAKPNFGEGWIVKSASDEQKTGKRPIWEVVADIGSQIPDEEWAKVPEDGAVNYKSYLYGRLNRD